MDRIIDKIKKVMALAEQGEAGEAQAARIALEAMLQKYGLKLEDLKNEKRHERTFQLKTLKECIIFYQCLANLFGKKSEAYRNTGIYKRQKMVAADMTDLEYADFAPFFEFHLENYRKERKKIMNSIMEAYVNKHKLFASDSGEEDQPEDEKIDFDHCLMVLGMMGTMAQVSYRKKLKE